jgi:hypothetical protein
MYYYFPTTPGLHKVGTGPTALDALKDSVGHKTANDLCDQMENLQWELRNRDGFTDECADLILKETGNIVGRFEKI